MQKAKPKASRGFTLLELIIVIAILAILSVAVVLVINPAETLARARDSQRLSDLSAMKSAIGLYMAEVTSVDLAEAAGDCGLTLTVPDDVWIGTSLATITDAQGVCSQTAAANLWESSSNLVTGAGWLPVNLTSITSGAPLSSWPLDPTDTVATGEITTGSSGTNDAFMYVYTCNTSPDVFEINANLESDKYTSGTSDKEGSDGGDTASLYEIGTDPGLDLCDGWGV